MNPEKIIEVRGLTKKFKNITAVNNINFAVYKGDVLGFLGPNGAGKSTTIRMLLSLIKPNSGTIKIFGEALATKRSDILRRVGALVEKADFYLYLSAYQNLKILAGISGVRISDTRIWEILELVKLSDRAYSKVKTFSHGMKQRLGIAQALIHNPDLIILDEPTTGLDPQGMKEVRELILHLSKDEGKTIFLSSHILKEIEDIASRLIIINRGSIQVEGEVDTLLKTENLSVTFETDNTTLALESIKNTSWEKLLVSRTNNRLVFHMPRKSIADLTKRFVEQQIPISGIIPKRSLEEYFLKITESQNE